MTVTQQLRGILTANRRGKGLGCYSICSANRFVVEAGMLQAARDHSLLLIESTSNQVNQYGGYTGQTPADFANFVHGTAKDLAFPRHRIILGGDHLGPHVWRKEPSSEAMAKARAMVEAYVRAGFTKIHLDASMPCADDKLEKEQTLPDEIVSARAAELCSAAEQAQLAPGSRANRPVYVIGTEVPSPGGEQSDGHAPRVTRPKDVARTLEIAKKAFHSRGLGSAWERVIAVVVQPGVEFGDTSVFSYEPRKAKPLSSFLKRSMRGWTGVYEAHSTDYQSIVALRKMVLDHFAILKVGPALTFAFREAVFALAAIEKELLCGQGGVKLSSLPEVLETAMLDLPEYWKDYYRGDDPRVRLARRYSYSDRARYYWPQPTVSAALQQLLHNLTTYAVPSSLLSQFMPNQAMAVRSGELPKQPAQLIRHKILEVIDRYAYACGLRQ